MWNAILQAVFQILLQIQNVVGDWGLAIIVLTVLIRMLLWPITAKQVKATFEMQKVAPEMKRIQEKYKDDKEKQNEELMKLYAEEGVNPFSSCLPMLIQMPIMIALYQVLGVVGKKPGLLMQHLANGEVGSFYNIIPDISLSTGAVYKTGDWVTFIPYVLLLAVFGLSAWLPQLLMPGEKNQKMIGLYMGAFLLFIGWNVPAGVLLFWDVSSLLGIAQQQISQASLRRATEGPAVIEAEDTKKPKKKK